MTRITSGLEAPISLSTYFPNPPPETEQSRMVTAVVNRTEERLAVLFQEFLTRQEEALIATGTISDRDRVAIRTISDRDRGDAIEQYASGPPGHLAIVQALLGSGPISDYSRGYAVYYASTYGEFAMVQALLGSGSISDYNRGRAVISASSGGHFSIVQALLGSGSISDYDRGDAVRAASHNGYLDVVQTLLASGSISDYDRGNAVQEASRDSHLDIVQALLAKGTLLSHLCAVTESLSHGRFQIAARLSLVPSAIGLSAIALYQAYALLYSE